MTTSTRSASLLAAFAGIAMMATPAAAQTKRGAAAAHETQAQLQAQAKITMVDARAKALAKVPNGTIKSEELEREHGKLLYSFDIGVAGKSGIDEVQVDAITGKMIGGVVHESAAAEKREAAMEAKEAKQARHAGTRTTKTP